MKGNGEKKVITTKKENLFFFLNYTNRPRDCQRRNNKCGRMISSTVSLYCPQNSL